jgi:hypothetical protein
MTTTKNFTCILVSCSFSEPITRIYCINFANKLPYNILITDPLYGHELDGDKWTNDIFLTIGN